MTNSTIEQQARELPGDLSWKLTNLRPGSCGVVCLNAEEWEYVRRALTPTGENARHVPDAMVQIDGRQYPIETVRTALLGLAADLVASDRALSAPGNNGAGKTQEVSDFYGQALQELNAEGKRATQSTIRQRAEELHFKAAITNPTPAAQGKPEPSECSHYFPMNSRRCVRCGWDFANGDPPTGQGKVAVPSNWCDPLLTGPNKALLGEPGTWDCADIERLLNGIRERLAANPTPAARVSVSELEPHLKALESFADDYSTYIPQFHAQNRKRMKAIRSEAHEAIAAIRRLVQAVKGEKL